MAVVIKGILPGSPAQTAGLKPDMCLVSIDGHEINDGLDYEFYSTRENPTLSVVSNGVATSIKVKKQEYQPLGCEFESYLIDKQHSCKNKCVFCFIDQLPKGMRSSLYFKDDDERLSFLFGNYITLTNLTSSEVQRIIDMRISPINISVHTVNPALRVDMMKNKHAGDVLAYIPQLAKAGISINTQLVLCPGLNDGDELRRSIEWLAELYPAMQSIAAVPVGLTKHRDGLYPLRVYNKEEAERQLDILLEYGDKFARQHGVRLVYPSDEWFLLAEREIPAEEFYDGYPQLENGVGMWRLLKEEFLLALEQAQAPRGPRAADVVVGKSAAPLLQELAAKLHQKFPNVCLTVHMVENSFFGPNITVSGLLTGQDIVNACKGKLKSKVLLLPDIMLRAEGDILLDDMTPAEIGELLQVEMQVVPQGGEGLLFGVLGI